MNGTKVLILNPFVNNNVISIDLIFTNFKFKSDLEKYKNYLTNSSTLLEFVLS